MKRCNSNDSLHQHPIFLSLSSNKYTKVPALTGSETSPTLFETLQKNPLFLKCWLPVAAWAVIILFASTSIGAGTHTADLLRAIWAWFHTGSHHTEGQIPEVNFLIRKTAHVLQFVIYALLVWRGWSMTPARRALPAQFAWGTIVSAALLALASEGIQLFVPLRSPLFSDVILDVCGAIAGVLIVLSVQSFLGIGRSSRLLPSEPACSEPSAD